MENLFQSSNNFIWSNLSKLGHGFSGTVYRGMHKESGEAVAVKAFHIRANLDSKVKEEVELAFLKREFDMLKKLKHENIVRLLAQETELRSQKDVLIMELCPGGSMLQVIEQPLNAFGLQEAEFICVMKDIVAGTQYLHNRNVVHRDMKPGNIVKSFKKDGSVIYKIIDFGAARFLLMGQQYESIHGTESYLHPCLFHSYYLKLENECPKSFKANFELWTIGATLYHLATGAVPFRPLHQNAKIMYHMIADKMSGVISAVEHPPGGEVNIEWKEELPKSCPFNLGLKGRIAFMLAQLIENDESKMWGFDQFFMYVNTLISSCPIYVFYVNEAKATTLYLGSDAKLKDLKSEIEAQLNVCEVEQLILFHNCPLESIVNSFTEICDYPVTSPSQPLVLFHNKNMTFSRYSNKSKDSKEAFHKARLMLNPPFTSSNISEGWMNCCLGYLLQRDIQVVCNICTLLLKVPNSLLCLSKQNVQKLMNEVDLLEQRIQDLCKRIEALNKSVNIVSELSQKSQLDIDLSNIFTMVEDLQQKESEVKEKFKFIGTSKKCLSQHHMSELQWNKVLKKLDVRIINQCLEDSEHYIHNNQKYFEEMKCAKVLRTLNDNKERMLENMNAFQISQGKLVKLYDDIANEFNEWYSGMFTIMTTCRDIENALRPPNELTVAGHLESFSLSINVVEKQLHDSIQSVISGSSSLDDMASIEIISLPPLLADVEPKLPVASLQSDNILKQPVESLQNGTLSGQSAASSQSDSVQKRTSKRNSHNSVAMREIHEKLHELSLSQNKLTFIVSDTDSIIERYWFYFL